MSIYCDVLGGLLIQEDLLVCLEEVKFREFLPSWQCGKQVLWLEKGVLVNLHGLVNCDLVVTTDPEGAILLRHHHNGGSPVTMADRLEDATGL